MTARASLVSHAQEELHAAWKLCHDLRSRRSARGRYVQPATLRSALRRAIAAGRSYAAAVVDAGGPYPSETICVTVVGPLGPVVGVQGPAWWAGLDRDTGETPLDAAESFIGGGSLDDLRRAIMQYRHAMRAVDAIDGRVS